MRNFIRLGLLTLLSGCAGEGDSAAGERPGTEATEDAGLDDASTGCASTTARGLDIMLDLSAVGTAPRGETLAPARVIVLDADGSEVAREAGNLSLPELEAGSYTLVFERLEYAPASTMTGEAYGVLNGAIRTVEVEACERTSVRVEYALLPSSGKLWVSSGEQLGAFSEAQLAGGGAVTPQPLLQVGFVNDFRGFAFDRLGSLWAATSPTYGSRLLWFAPEQLAESERIEPRGEIHAQVFDDFAPVSDVIFQADGSLRVALRSADSTFTGFAVWTRAQLIDAMRQGGVVEMEPAAMVPLTGFGGRVDLELSPSGALWVAAYDNDTLLRIDDPLTWEGPEPDATFTVVSDVPGGAAQTGPENIAFASDGDAVAIFWASGALMELGASDLARSGAAQLSVSLDDFWVDQLPQGLVVDGNDRVVVGNYAGNGTGQFLGWTPGTMPEPLASSTDLTDPTDLLLDPRPR